MGRQPGCLDEVAVDWRSAGSSLNIKLYLRQEINHEKFD